MSYRYIGNKTRTLAAVIAAISKQVPPGSTVADLMCGTASVSAGLRDAGFLVVASDIMTYAYQHAVVRLTIARPPDFGGLGLQYEEVLDHLNNLVGFDGYMVREYSPSGLPAQGCAPRLYLSTENARQLDAINRQIRLWLADGRLSTDEHSLLRHDLVLATNRIANIAGTYGHFRSSWTKGSMARLFLLPSKFLPGNSVGHTVLQGPAEEVAARVTADLCYLDPPYMKRQYAANYHLLETIARGDEPDAVGISGLRPWRDQYSDFCSKLKIRGAFERILRQIKCPEVLISYSEDGLLSRNEMLNFLESFGQVRYMEYGIPRFKSNRGGSGGFVTEYFFFLSLR